MRSEKPFLATALLFVGSLAFGQSAPEPVPPKLRLGDAVRPVRQALELTLLPAEETFTGRVEIDLDLRVSLSVLWLNGTGLKVREASLLSNGRTLTARVIPGDEDVLGLAFDRPVGPGSGRLHIVYEGVMSRRDTEGIFAQQDAGEWYAFSQFEPLGSRRAFPCFDEPSFKIPWRVSLRVKKEHVALSNSPEVSSLEGEGGMKTVVFAETKPLPSYLVAVAVGPFDLVDSGRAGRKGTQVRIVTPRGRTQEARWAAEATPRILSLLEEYFDMAYPYEKLDQVAIPLFFGAMEHPGLVTYGETFLLQKPEEETVQGKRTFVSIAAHELAHQWFGNLVTMAWWDDVWLNESFASWMGEKITDRFRPEWEIRVSKVAARSSALQEDSLTTARKIRQPIETKHEIANAFDPITYAKGEAVLEMFEAWLGEDAFQKGVRRYLTEHAWGNATAANFFAALSAEAGRNIAAPFSTFLEQTGAPVISAEIRCGGGAPPRLSLSQRPYRPLGSRDASPKSWHVPVCVRYGVGSALGRECALLTEAAADLALASTTSCPDWVMANDGEAGYYRAGYGGNLLSKLLEDGGRRLTASERVGVIGDIGALVASGDLPVSDALDLVGPLAGDPNRQVVSSTIEIVRTVAEMVPEALRSRYAAFVRALYAQRARALGLRARPDEDEETRLLRQTLISIVGVEGEDAGLGAEALALSRRWLEDPRAVDPDMVEVVLRLAARYGDRGLFERLREEARKTQDRERRGRLLQALGSFRDPAIARAALAVALEDGIDPRETIDVVFTASSDPATRPLAYSFVKEHYETLVRRLPQGSVFSTAAYFPYLANRFCDEERRADVGAFFSPRAASITGGPRIVEQVLEGIDLCVAQRRVQQPSVVKFVEKHSRDATSVP